MQPINNPLRAAMQAPMLSLRGADAGVGGAGIVIESVSTTTAISTSTLPVTPPDGIIVGEFLLLIVCNDTANNADSIVTPTAWNKVGSIGSGPDDCEIAIFWKIADGSEIGFNVTWPNDGTAIGAASYWHRMSGVDTTNPIDAFAFNTQGGVSTTFSIPQITTVTANALALFVLSYDGGDGFPFTVSGTDWDQTHELQSSSSGNASSSTIGIKPMETPGATGNVSVTSPVSDGAVFAQIAIKPA